MLGNPILNSSISCISPSCGGRDSCQIDPNLQTTGHGSIQPSPNWESIHVHQPGPFRICEMEIFNGATDPPTDLRLHLLEIQQKLKQQDYEIRHLKAQYASMTKDYDKQLAHIRGTLRYLIKERHSGSYIS
jgi:hypothetical protein